MPPTERYDAVVIGAGSGGLTVALGLAGFGRRVALVEAAHVGGDCTHAGCIPSKRLIHLAGDRAWREDPSRALAEVRATRDRLSAREAADLEADPRIDLVRGRASLRPGRRVRVEATDGDRELLADNVIVATGSRPRRIAIPGVAAERLLTTAELFELPRPPRHLAIVGAGPVGVEMACAFAALGSRVTLLGSSPRVLPGAEPAASAVLREALVERGVRVATGTPATGAAVGDAEAVLLAVGRHPNVEGFEDAVATGARGIAVDAWGRTSARGVWAVGDVTPAAHQTHGANAYGRRVVQAIALPLVPRLGRPPVIPSAVFSDPEVAWVGPTAAERATRCHPRALVDLRVELADTDRGLTDGLRRGFVAVTAVRLTGRVVAATAVGPRASELLPLLTLAVSRRASLWRLGRLVQAYPTLAGAIGAAADEFARGTAARGLADVAAYGRYRWARTT